MNRDEEEEYDPVAHRPPGPTTSDFAVMMHLVKGSIGTGILFLPNGFRRTGYVMSVICGIFIGLLCTHTVVALVIEFFSGVELDARIYILALFPVICMLGFIPNLKYLAPFSMIGTMFVLTGICVTVSYLVEDIPDPGRLNAFTYVLPVPMYCTMFLFSLHNVTLCMPLENTMKNPTHLPRLIRCNILLNTCLYTTFGFLGYNKYADATCDTVIKNLPVDHTLAQVIKIAISLSVLCSYGLAFYVPISILWPMLKPRFEAYRFGEAIFRLCGIVGTTILAIAIPEMIPLLGFLTAFSMTTIMLLIPISVETATKWEEATRFFLAKNICIFLIWILLLVFGAIQSMRAIIREYGGTKVKGC
ncbi:proton-coupled amino acid transporter-like protein pathetic isoform X2 [Xylocopa sonorina]|uniref:proton-coupled amino acid transporter-like protein pathetic isoform X2 n=1 Tax=Xylocopa sonorina TaxID=1818115 RepID=UPI00403AB6BE